MDILPCERSWAGRAAILRAATAALPLMGVPFDKERARPSSAGLFLRLLEPDACPAAVLVNELDAGRLKGGL